MKQNKHTENGILMIQNKLKLLIILSNLLLSHLSNHDQQVTYNFVKELSNLIKESLANESDAQSFDNKYHAIKDKINNDQRNNMYPSATQAIHIEDEQLNQLIIPFGFNLLLELTYVFIVHCKSDVLPVQLRAMIIGEYHNILNSLVQADSLF